jgi:hypothetical protein
VCVGGGGGKKTMFFYLVHTKGDDEKETEEWEKEGTEGVCHCGVKVRGLMVGRGRDSR